MTTYEKLVVVILVVTAIVMIVQPIIGAFATARISLSKQNQITNHPTVETHTGSDRLQWLTALLVSKRAKRVVSVLWYLFTLFNVSLVVVPYVYPSIVGPITVQSVIRLAFSVGICVFWVIMTLVNIIQDRLQEWIDHLIDRTKHLSDVQKQMLELQQQDALLLKRDAELINGILDILKSQGGIVESMVAGTATKRSSKQSLDKMTAGLRRLIERTKDSS